MDGKFTVIFDFDGTLANTIELAIRIYNQHHEEFGSLPIDIKQLPEFQKLGYKKVMKKTKIRWRMLPKMALTISREMKQHMGEVEPYPGIVEMLKKLQENDISIGVLTSNNVALVQDYFTANNFPTFDFIFSEKTLFGKEKTLRKIVKRYNLNKKRVLYVGDEPRDVVSCRKAKIPIIGVSWGLGGVDGLTPSKPDKIVDNSDQLFIEILKIKNSQ